MSKKQSVLKYFRTVKCFDGGDDFVMWMDKLKLIAELNEVEDLASVIPQFLAGKAYSVYAHLSTNQKKSAADIEKALKKAYSMDAFVAYDRLKMSKWVTGSVDEYLSELQSLFVLAGMSDERGLLNAFVTGMPPRVSSVLRTYPNIANMRIDEVVSVARSIVGAEPEIHAYVGKVGYGGYRTGKAIICFKCHEPGHVSSKCTKGSAASVAVGRYCFVCGKEGHMARACPDKHSGNGEGNLRAQADSH